MFIQSLKISILVYIPTAISLLNHMQQFRNILSPVVMLAHVMPLLLKLSITDLHEYWIFVESLRT